MDYSNVNSSNRANLSFASERPLHVVMTGFNDEEELIDDEQIQYISPYDASKSPMNDSASLVKPEEIIIVGGVLILWISVIALFIHKWGKIRGLEPYIPHFDRTLHPHTTAVVAVGNQVQGVTIQGATSICSGTTVNTSPATAVNVTTDPTGDTVQVKYPRVFNKTRVNQSNKQLMMPDGKDKWLRAHGKLNQSSPPQVRSLSEHGHTKVNENINGSPGDISSENNSQGVYNSRGNTDTRDTRVSERFVNYSPAHSSYHRASVDTEWKGVKKKKMRDDVRRKKSSEYFYPYSPRRPRASIDSSTITASHIVEYSLNSPVVFNERLVQSHMVDFDQSPYLRHKEGDIGEEDEPGDSESVYFNSIDCQHVYHSTHSLVGDRVNCTREISDETSGHESASSVHHCEQLNHSRPSDGRKRRQLHVSRRDEIFRDYRSYIDIPSLVLLRMASSEPNIAESRFDS